MVWQEIDVRLGGAVGSSVEVVEHLLDFSRELIGVVCTIKHLLTWLATCWEIWCMRNDMYFNTAVFQVTEVVHRIKLLSWLWNIIEISANVYCNYTQWCNRPIDFLNS